MSTAYVGLGDSYAAGVGAGERFWDFWRTTAGYPLQVARRLGVEVTFEAFLGATVADVLTLQLGALGPATRYVTVTVGGNDIGFAPVLIVAAEPSWMSDSDHAIDGAFEAVAEVLPGRLDGLYARIAHLAPRAKVVVTDYPRLFGDRDCNLLTFFSDHERTRLNAVADALTEQIARAAERAGFGLARVLPPFVGHAVCAEGGVGPGDGGDGPGDDEREWINGVAWPVQASFHPNVLGHQVYAGCAVRELEPDPEQRRHRKDPVVVQGAIAQGSAPVFHLPDLTSTRSLAGAARHGLDPQEIRELAHRAGLAGSQPAPAGPGALGRDPVALARLHELDAEVRGRR